MFSLKASSWKTVDIKDFDGILDDKMLRLITILREKFSCCDLKIDYYDAKNPNSKRYLKVENIYVDVEGYVP